ncbi:hypothetical protein ACE3MZ_10235 [Paenibacillus sp. WLX1005]|uniref:hypothetical protein n=1 Tax=Paenibacillus sp. WLX1005 TaxID=3243766 RepID=UPI0039841181
MRAYLFLPVIASLIFAPATINAEQAASATLPATAGPADQIVSTSSWEYPIVHFRNSTYRIMMEPALSTVKVGPRLGKVERNISSFEEVDENNSMIDTTYKNGDSNVLNVDSPIYKFRNRSTKDCIIVSHKNKYYKAVLRTDYSDAGDALKSSASSIVSSPSA